MCGNFCIGFKNSTISNKILIKFAILIYWTIKKRNNEILDYFPFGWYCIKNLTNLIVSIQILMNGVADVQQLGIGYVLEINDCFIAIT